MVNIVQTGTLLRAKGGSTHNYARTVDIKTGTDAHLTCKQKLVVWASPVHSV